MKKRGEMRRERRRMKGRDEKLIEATKEMKETGWRLKKTRMGSSGLD
jgi:hypothetical protein